MSENTGPYFVYGEEEIAFLKAKDKKLGAVIDRVGPIRRPVDTDLFESVMHHIVGQQISTKAQRTIWARLQGTLGDVTAQSIADASPEELQSLGMTFRKVDYMQDFARKVLDGSFDLDAVGQMSDEDAIAALSSLKGIGVWTAEMLLLFCLQRPDVLSYGDLAILRGMRMVYRHRKIDRKLFEKYRRRLSPCGSVASLYFWAVAGGAIPELTDPGVKKK
ncbi:MAG: DNA-3-methyladenine glycosylase 2 family protein [Firmicutes bacterium]|nr:DNA-3-methyladenine glycosylase 2 family protein [Bacillota bacterium]